MTDLKSRENALENKYANDAETRFKIEARACKLMGLWAAQEMGMTGADADSYAGEVVSSNLKEPGVQDVIDKVAADFDKSGLDTAHLAAMMARFLGEAEQQYAGAA